MNNRRRKTKVLSRRLIAWLICCVCLIGAMPISAIALETNAAPVEEKIVTEKPTEDVTVEPETAVTVTPAPTALTNLADTSVDVGSSDTELETITDSGAKSATETTTEPVTETTTQPVTETITEPAAETTTQPATETTVEPTGEPATSPAPEVMDEKAVSDNTAVSLASDISLASIGGADSITLKIGESATVTSDVTGTSADSDHQESWASDNEGVAKVDFTLGNDYKATSATVTGVSAGTATITHTYYIEEQVLFWTQLVEHTETIQVTVYAQEYTVTFSVGVDAAAAGVATPDDITVTEGQTISDLPEPVWKSEDGQFVKVFAGWYSDEALTTEFTSETVVNDNTKLHAKWVEPTEEGVYYVNFYSQDGQTVHLTLSAMAGKTVAPAQGPTLVGKVFKGWSITPQGDSPVADLQAFDFNTPISEVAKQGANGKTLNLYAWYADAVTVSFVANGGTAVASQFIAKGDTATSVQPTREGYTFRGWSTNKDTYTPFDFTTPVNENLTLYAFWDAKLVPVTIVYMYENANDAEYSPAGNSVKVYAPAGSYVSIEKNSNITNPNGSHAVRYADTMDGALTGYAKQSANANAGNATIPDISDTYYQYETASNKRWVNPDGSTTVLAYYNRARVTLTFAYNQSDTTASIDYTNLISEANRTKYAVSYTQDSTSKFTYSFTAKYGEDITAVWPQVAWVKDNSGNTPSDGSDTFRGWVKPSETVQTTNMYTLEWDLFGTSRNNGLTIENGELVGKNTLNDSFTEVTEKWAIYARTTLPGETVDFVYNGKNYTIYTEACQMLMSGGDLGYKKLDGCTAVNGEPEFKANYSTRMSMNNLSANTGSTIKEKFDTVFAEEVKNGKLSSGDVCQVLLYNRNTLTLNVWTNDDTYGSADSQTKSYLYGDNIYDEQTDLLKSLEKEMKKEGYVFAGWYTTSEFTPGTEYKPDENSAITANMLLYAKWEPNQFRAEYYLYMDDAAPYAWQGFAEGGKIDDKLVPSAVQGSFLGWFWYQNGQLVPFDFTSAVGANHVDKNGVLKLYAKWSGTNGKVSYLPGIGGDNATQEVVDGREFAINEASVQLPQYTEVWGSGVPNDPALTFVGWKAPNGVIYQPGRYVLVTRNLMQFEAQWSKDAVKLIYDANEGDGDNVTENWARNSVVSVWDNMDGTTPHFTREYYTLLGWDEDPNATEPDYPLGEERSIKLEKNVTTLYAIWKQNTVALTIQKTVSGNMYSDNDVFSFTLRYGKNYETFTLKNGENKIFQVPVGAEVSVTENLENSNGYIPGIGTGTTVTLTATLVTDGIFEFTMPEEDGTLVINNDKTVQIDTGISLETVPYILILAVVVIGAVLLIKRRRNRYYD